MRRTNAVLAAVLLIAGSGWAQEKKSEKPAPRASRFGAKMTTEAAIKDLYERWATAFRARDIEAIMAMYARGDDVVAYDIVAPLEYKGAAAYRKDYEEFLGMFTGPIEVEFREMRVVASGDVGFVHALERISGTMKNGQKMDLWLRATSGVRKYDGKWLIVHDHISVPADMETGKAMMDLKP
ncbi:MAG TPA: SgcJ/EcaC family oxidoreductase [Terriglobales bacterium]|nr:SgcJ/EcaC family oxidoreductase [Terriglobales bacterium]